MLWLRVPETPCSVLEETREGGVVRGGSGRDVELSSLAGRWEQDQGRAG